MNGNVCAVKLQFIYPFFSLFFSEVKEDISFSQDVFYSVS